MSDYRNSISLLIEEMIKQQETKVLKIAREILPHTTPEDIRNPQDFSELNNDIKFNYEDGILTGYLSMKVALLRIIKI